MSLRYLNKTQKTIGLVVAAVLVVGAFVGAALVMRSSPPPAPQDDLLELVKFVKTDQFERLPEIEKQPYMKRLRSGADQLRALRAEGKITQFQYEQAYLNAWMARQLDNMEEYYSLPAAVRQQKLLAKYSKPSTGPSAPKDPYEPNEETEDDFIKQRIATWTPEMRQQWDEYRTAVKAAKSAAKARAGK
jgi:hypothetical protein